MGHHSAAQSTYSEDKRRRRTEKSRHIMVAAGISLFVVGFLMTLAAIEDNHATAASNGEIAAEENGPSSFTRDLYVMSGILVSLSGVVLATVGPAADMFRGSS